VFMMKFDTLGQQEGLGAGKRRASVEANTLVYGNERGGAHDSSRSPDIPEEDPGVGKLGGIRSKAVCRPGVYKTMRQVTNQTK
jgi:hypothetical protein